MLIKASTYLSVDWFCWFVWFGFFQIGEDSDIYKYTTVLVSYISFVLCWVWFFSLSFWCDHFKPTLQTQGFLSRACVLMMGFILNPTLLLEFKHHIKQTWLQDNDKAQVSAPCIFLKVFCNWEWNVFTFPLLLPLSKTDVSRKCSVIITLEWHLCI